MVDQLFTDENISTSASYTQAPAGAISVRIVRVNPPLQEISFGQTRAKLAAYGADIRQSEVAQPKQGDLLTVGAENFKVIGFEYDAEKLVWKLNLDKI